MSKKIKIFFLAFVLICSCFAFLSEAKERGKNKKNSIRIAKMTKNDFKILGKDLDHPGKFSLEEIKDALTSIYYKEKNPVSWKVKQTIFKTKTVTQISLLIQKALSRLNPKSKISFSLSEKEGKTTGNLFAKKNALIFKFNAINGLPYIDVFDLKVETEAELITNWKLIPGANQQIFSTKGILGLLKRQKTMIIVDMTNRDNKKHHSDVDNQKTVTGGKGGDIEDKLRYLKELKRKQLISEDAYEKKVGELLDKL